jgi:hypothetical protein
MVTGRDSKLVGQAGEFIVAGELARRGYVSTTFTGNVPDYDIICSSGEGKHLSIQVKAAMTGSWHLRITRFCHMSFEGPRQVVGELKTAPVIDLVTVFVVLAGQGDDRFFILPWGDLRDIVVTDYSRWLGERGWVRPKNPQSLHCAILERQIAPFRDAWGVIDRLLGPSAV